MLFDNAKEVLSVQDFLLSKDIPFMLVSYMVPLKLWCVVSSYNVFMHQRSFYCDKQC